MVQQDWKSAAILLQLGANPEVLTQQKETASQTFCRLLERMDPKIGLHLEDIVATGDELDSHHTLPSECRQRLDKFRQIK
jgi:hypothetical protein